MEPSWSIPSGWEYNLFVVPMAVSAVVAAGLAYLGWQKRTAQGAFPFALIMAGLAVWSVLSALEQETATLSGKLFWANAFWLCSTFSPIVWFALAAQHTGRESRVTTRILALLAVVPGVSIILVWTTPIPGTVRASAVLEEFGGLDFLVTTFGPWFWFLIAYSYVLLLIGSLLLIHMAATSPDVYRKQAIAIVAGAALPWAGTAVYLSGILSWPLNLTPFTLVGSDVVMGWAMFRFNLLDIVPMAQGTLVKDMSDGVIVLDDDDRIANLNAVAERIIGQGGSRAVGRPITSLYEHASIFTGTSTSGTTQFGRSLPVEGSPMHFSVTVSPVSTRRHR